MDYMGFVIFFVSIAAKIAHVKLGEEGLVGVLVLYGIELIIGQMFPEMLE